MPFSHGRNRPAPGVLEAVVIRPNHSQEVIPLNLASDNCHGYAPRTPDQETERDIAEPMDAEHEPGVDHKHRTDKGNEPRPPDAIRQCDAPQ